ncbi:rhomboid family intramembrane serine protease [Hymenobacter taeanensis]|uniref:Rhomboid family intramembrane serine protease n=1 Tax=Hymenobacter taeanensis TaxID=2735321 RepID=A0A6M6BL66_9BACT|nr:MULTISPECIES: rhomboid family intramembrane serine protease [Hymenobacter]QJX48856.1 rhomboid family intramembrane serine protease [Hymenobacter taeanensis]UOQ81633.1 rhomboid family intramembrane serine protease [Hymenobacter sp. 5414T-23]
MLTNYGFKLRYIFLPAVLLVCSFLVVYGLLYWLLVLKWEFFDPNSDLVFWLPFALGGLATFWGLRSRVNLLQRSADSRWVTLYYLAPCVIILIGSLTLCDYLTQATGILTTLSAPNEVARFTPTRFYALKQGYAYKPGAGLEVTVTPTGKNNTQLQIKVYAACPILATAADSSTSTAALWLAWTRSKQIAAGLPQQEKEQLFKEFLTACESEFRAADLDEYRYLSRVTAADGKAELQTAARRSPLYRASGPLVLVMPQTGLFEERTVAPLRHLVWALSIGFGVYLLMLVFPQVGATTGELWLAGGTATPLWPQIRPIILPRPGYVVTPLLVGSIVLVYLAMVGAGLGVTAFRSADLLRWGASSGLVVQQGEWWRLLTSTFLHGGLMHILYNALALGMISWLIEPVAGALRLLITYFVSTVGAGLVSTWWHPETVSVGASGAIFGLFGVSIMLSLSPRIPEEDRGSLLLIPLLFGIPSLLFGWFIPSVDNAAHLGGLATGLLVGAALLPTFPSYYQRSISRY